MNSEFGAAKIESCVCPGSQKRFAATARAAVIATASYFAPATEVHSNCWYADQPVFS